MNTDQLTAQQAKALSKTANEQLCSEVLAEIRRVANSGKVCYIYPGDLDKESLSHLEGLGYKVRRDFNTMFTSVWISWE